MIAASIEGADSILTEIEEIFKTQRDEIKAGLNILVRETDKTGMAMSSIFLNLHIPVYS